MARFTLFKRKRRTRNAGFRSYKSNKLTNRKPFVPKKEMIKPKKRGRRDASRRSRLSFFLKITGVAILVLIVIYTLFFTRLFEMQKIEIKGSAETLEEQAGVREYLEGYLGTNMVVFPSIKHEKVLLESYPYLKGLNIRRTLNHSLVVTLKTYEHKANIQINQEDDTKKFYIVNELGFIASIGSYNEQLPTIVMDVTGTDLELPESEEGLQVNQEILPKKILESLLSTEESFEARFNMQVLEVHYLKRARELHLFTERYFFVWIDLSQDIDTQLTKLKKSITEVNFYEAKLEYIDLRISGQNGEKVIYKLSE